jgi:hypothetical protein
MILYYRIRHSNLPRIVLHLRFICVEFKLSVNLTVVCVSEQLFPTTLTKCKHTVNLKANTVRSRLLEVPFRRCAAVKVFSMLVTAFSSEVYL